jgi:hypothetical protein
MQVIEEIFISKLESITKVKVKNSEKFVNQYGTLIKI